MYKTFYHLHAQPFQLTSDPGFLFYSDEHNRALDCLYYGIYQGEGLVVITGDVGTGKTTLVYKLLEKLTEQKNIIAAHLVATQRKAEYLLPMVATAFGLAQESSSNVILLQRLEKFLINQAQEGKGVVLIVDEAQNLSMPALEELRLLTNYQFNYTASLQIFLIGQPEFRNLLYSGPLKSLRQRLIASCHLGPLAGEETRCYIEHRLSVVGWKGDPTFTPEAYVAIHHFTSGVPRQINLLCHRVLVLGCLEKAHEINEELINRVIQDWKEESFSADDPEKQYPNKVRILHQQPRVPPESVNPAASNVPPLDLNFQKRHQAPSVSGVQARPKVTAATAGTLAPLRVESESAENNTANLTLNQQASTADKDSQQYAFFKRQGLLLALPLLLLTSVGVYQLIYYQGGWSVQPRLVRENGSALPERPEPVAPASQSSMTPVVVKALEKSAVGVVPPAPIKLPMPELATERVAPVSPADPSFPLLAQQEPPATLPPPAATGPSPVPAMSPAPAVASAEKGVSVTAYMSNGDRLLMRGDVASARLFYEAAATSGSAAALTAIGRTYDPLELSRLGIRGARADPAKAAQWYLKAKEHGDPEAAGQISRLQRWLAEALGAK